MVTQTLDEGQTDKVIESGCVFSVDLIRRARLSLKSGKTCGSDGVV